MRPVPVVDLRSPLAVGLVGLWHASSPAALVHPAGSPAAATPTALAAKQGGPLGFGYLGAAAFGITSGTPFVGGVPPFTLLSVGTAGGLGAAMASAGFSTVSGTNGIRSGVDATGALNPVLSGSASYTPGGSQPTAGDVFHYCLTVRDPAFDTGEMIVYVNGSRVSSATVTAYTPPTTPIGLNVGFGSGAGAQPWVTPGLVSMVALWRRILPPQHVAALYRDPSAMFVGAKRKAA